jgi:hypothetical protein
MQWASRLPNWRQRSHGLLDRLIPVPAIGESDGSHGAPHSSLLHITRRTGGAAVQA